VRSRHSASGTSRAPSPFPLFRSLCGNTPARFVVVWMDVWSSFAAVLPFAPHPSNARAQSLQFRVFGGVGRCECCGGPLLVRSSISRRARKPFSRLLCCFAFAPQLIVCGEVGNAGLNSHELLSDGISGFAVLSLNSPADRLYQQVIVSLGQASTNEACQGGPFRRAYQRFCEWPVERRLRIPRRVFHYVVIDEYLRSI